MPDIPLNNKIDDIELSDEAEPAKLEKVNLKQDTMLDTLKDIRRRLGQPSGRAALTVFVMIIGFFGVEANAEALGEVLVQIINGIIAVITGGTVLWEMFRDEDKGKT